MSKSDHAHPEARTTEEVDWPAIRPHLARDAVIVISPELDLELVARQIASDEKQVLEKEIKAGRVTKPTLQDLPLNSVRHACPRILLHARRDFMNL